MAKIRRNIPAFELIRVENDEVLAHNSGQVAYASGTIRRGRTVVVSDVSSVEFTEYGTRTLVIPSDDLRGFGGEADYVGDGADRWLMSVYNDTTEMFITREQVNSITIGDVPNPGFPHTTPNPFMDHQTFDFSGGVSIGDSLSIRIYTSDDHDLALVAAGSGEHYLQAGDILVNGHTDAVTVGINTAPNNLNDTSKAS